MGQTCIVTGKTTTFGNNVAHCNKKVKRQFKANVHTKKFWSESKNQFVKLAVSNKGMKTIDKYGVDAVLEMIQKREQLA